MAKMAVLGLLSGGAMAQETAPKITDLDAQPVAAGDLHAAYFHWNDQVVTIVGYPALFMSPSPWKSRLSLGAAPEEKTPALATCKLDSRATRSCFIANSENAVPSLLNSLPTQRGVIRWRAATASMERSRRVRFSITSDFIASSRAARHPRLRRAPFRPGSPRA